MRFGRPTRTAAALGALALLVAACGDDDEGADETTTTEASDTDTTEAEVEINPATDRLVIGRVLPDTGPLSFLGPPMIVGVNLAIEDINAAGGVLGQPVELLEADEGETPQIAREGVVRMLGQGANVIVGAAASGSSQEFIQLLSDNSIPQCSGSNTSPSFSTQDNADFYFRTVPPDDRVAPIIADRVIADGRTNVAVVARADDYGQALADLVEQELAAANVSVTVVTYDPEASSFDAEVEQVVGAAPDAVVLISFDEGGQVLAGLIERGITPDTVYGSDGVFGPTFDEQVDPNNPNIIDGMIVIGAAGDEQFNARIAEPTENNFIYGGQTYDCAIVMALAAEAAGSVRGEDIIAEIGNVTSGGTKCFSFAECKELLAAGEDIDYDGAAGPLELNDVGDPTVGRYAIGRFENGEITIIASQDVEIPTS